MDLHPSAPYASVSSFPSPTPFQKDTDPLLSLENFHDFHHREGSTSPSPNAFPKLPFPDSTSSFKARDIEIDLTSELFSTSTTTAATWGPTTATHERIRSSTSPYFSPNKIAHCSPSIVGKIDYSPLALSSPLTSGSSTLQGILHRCGLGSSAALDSKHNKNHQQDGFIRPATSPFITRKIRNLDEILRNLDHYSMSKRFTLRTNKDLKERLPKKPYQCPTPDTVQDMSSEQLMSNVDHSFGNVGGSVIPNGITHINKSISRMEFRAQMEKLTGIIDDQWPGNKRVEKVERIETKGVANGPSDTVGQSLVRNVQEHLQVDPPPQPTHKNGTDAFAASTNILEEMLKNITGLEHCLVKRERSKQAKQRAFHARGRLWVQMPTRKKMPTKLQKQFKQHFAFINRRLDKTDLAMKSLRRQQQEALSPFFVEGNYHVYKNEKKAGRVSHSSSNIQTSSVNESTDISNTTLEKKLPKSKQPFVIEKCMEACGALSRSMQHVHNQLCTLHRDSQQMGQSLEKIQKQSCEQSMEIELCWTAINHLCIDNQTFREELQAYQLGSEQQQHE